MSFLLNPRVLVTLALVLALAFSHFTAYRKGRNVVKLEWQASVAAANAEARALEQRRQRRADEAGRLAAARAADDRNRAVRADRALAGMRDTLDAVERNAARSLEACGATVAAYRAVFGACTQEYRELGAAAAGHASDALTLDQAWPADPEP